MTLAELTPDTALAALLDGKVTVDDDAKIVKVYAQGEQPNVDVAKDYISVINNGVIISRTKPIGLFTGNLALSVNCKVNNDNSIKLSRMRKLVAQCERIVNGKVSDGFFFELDATNVITPPTVNLTTGYATTILNVAWRTNDY